MSGKAAQVGIRLVIEVLDKYHGPDARKLWLIAWAEKANDRTRAGWPTREVLSHRTGRSPSRASHIADELIAEGVLKRDGGGNRSGPARFILLPLADPVKSAPRTHPSGAGENTPGTDSDETIKSAPSAHPSDAPKGAESAHPETVIKSAPSAHPKPEVKGAESPGKGAESGRKGAGSKPRPAETGSLPLTIPSIDQPSQEPTADADAPTAQTIVARFIDWVRDSGGDLTERTIGQIARQVGDLLKQGKSERDIRTGLANWYLADQNVSTLDSFVNSVINAAARDRLTQNGAGPGHPRPSTTDRAVAQAQALKAKLGSRSQEAP